MTRDQLIRAIRSKSSCLCVGLDTDLNKLPPSVRQKENPALYFNRSIIDATKDYAVAYKLNLAFYEAMGVAGWQLLYDTIDAIGSDYLIIADAKRGDIGNTAAMYAKAIFEDLNADAVTLNPYMGVDTLKPFLSYSSRWSIVLACTSNDGSADFQKLPLKNKGLLYEEVIRKTMHVGSPDQLMFVVGATQQDNLAHIRSIAPMHFFLVPGVGAQGGSVESVMKAAATPDIGLLINSSRSILYASQKNNFAEEAAKAASSLQSEMRPFIRG